MICPIFHGTWRTLRIRFPLKNETKGKRGYFRWYEEKGDVMLIYEFGYGQNWKIDRATLDGIIQQFAWRLTWVTLAYQCFCSNKYFCEHKNQEEMTN